jgi:hypothetical protein
MLELQTFPIVGPHASGSTGYVLAFRCPSDWRSPECWVPIPGMNSQLAKRASSSSFEPRSARCRFLFWWAGSDADHASGHTDRAGHRYVGQLGDGRRRWAFFERLESTISRLLANLLTSPSPPTSALMVICLVATEQPPLPRGYLTRHIGVFETYIYFNTLMPDLLVKSAAA